MSHYYLGIDVSKGYADFIMLDANKRIVEQNFRLDDTFTGHHKLFQFLTQFFEAHEQSTVFAAVESTGGYENNWYQALHKFQEQFSLHVARLNPKGVNHNSKAGLNRIITDELSAKNIAEYLITHPEKVTYHQQDYYYALRRKWKFIQSLTKEKTKYLNQLETMLYQAHPELLVFCKNGVSQWVLKLLQQFPTAHALSQATVDTIASIPYISNARARRLIHGARHSVASMHDALTEDSISVTATRILDLEKLIKQQITIITQQCAMDEFALIKTFKSIGDFSAIGLLIEIGAVQRFPSVKHLASYFGLHPVFKASGDGTHGMRMSKQGRKQPRAILFMVTLTAIHQNPLIKEIYTMQLKKGKCKMDAIGVCMHKILRIIYGMLKNKTAFDPEIDRNYRKRTVNQKNATPIDKNRRYQQPDAYAPISRRQSIKRKQQEQSQNEQTVTNGITFPPLSLN